MILILFNDFAAGLTAGTGDHFATSQFFIIQNLSLGVPERPPGAQISCPKTFYVLTDPAECGDEHFLPSHILLQPL